MTHSSLDLAFLCAKSVERDSVRTAWEFSKGREPHPEASQDREGGGAQAKRGCPGAGEGDVRAEGGMGGREGGDGCKSQRKDEFALQKHEPVTAVACSGRFTTAHPPSTGETFQDPQLVPETVDSTEPCSYPVFLIHTYLG